MPAFIAGMLIVGELNESHFALRRPGWPAGIAARACKAENYPNKPVQIIADSSAGSTPDVALRFVADRLTQLWGQQVLVVNRPGAGGSLAARRGSGSRA